MEFLNRANSAPCLQNPYCLSVVCLQRPAVGTHLSVWPLVRQCGVTAWEMRADRQWRGDVAQP